MFDPWTKRLYIGSGCWNRARRTQSRREPRRTQRTAFAGGDIMTRPPVPPFDEESARQKVKAAEDGWNTRDPEKGAQAYTEDSEWRNRDEFFEGREEIVAFLTRK